MCRLYGFHATHATQPACDLLDAQNARIHQSRQDARGLSNPDGWGLGRVDAEGVTCYRQVAPASKSDAFRAEALRTRGTTAIQGDTDSEHFFQRVLTRYDQRERSSMTGALADAVNDVVQWSAECDAGAEVALNTLWSDGNRLTVHALDL